MQFKFRNINDAFSTLISGLYTKNIPSIETKSRNGTVLQIPEPVLITYTNPTERVLFNGARDWPCYFVLYEALWMLAGRNDVAPLAYYNKQMKEYSDDGKTFNGAYGYRWRNSRIRPLEVEGYADEVDQLDTLVAHLKANPNSRRAVLQMWNVEEDLLKIGGIGNRVRCDQCHGIGGVNLGPPDDMSTDVWVKCPKCYGSSWIDAASKDICCNLSVMFSVRNINTGPGDYKDDVKVLDMTVTNRSNDLVWGLLGANYVHFSILQEYLASRLKVEVGHYHHFTNNLHAYVERKDWKPKEWLEDKETLESRIGPPYVTGKGSMVPLVQNPIVFEEELLRFVDYYSEPNIVNAPIFTEPFLHDVAHPMLRAFHLHKAKDYGGEKIWVDKIKADDWKLVAQRWLERRKK